MSREDVIGKAGNLDIPGADVKRAKVMAQLTAPLTPENHSHYKTKQQKQEFKRYQDMITSNTKQQMKGINGLNLENPDFIQPKLTLKGHQWSCGAAVD